MMNKSVLDYINAPEDIKSLSKGDKIALSGELRRFLLSSVSVTGGHLASNLGVVELTIAMLSVLDSENEIVWDVGHQSYVYKILTGRKDRFGSLRTYGGLSGFPKRGESKYDYFDTGHSSTSISSAVGIAVGKRMTGKKGSVFAVIGDGALTGGMAYEAINHLGHTKEDVKIILNDNQMSISPNVGGLVNSMRASSKYAMFKKGTKGMLDRIPIVGPSLTKGIQAVKRAFRTFFIGSGQIFEELGIKYLGRVDGHDIVKLEKALRKLSAFHGPAILHVYTVKGKGYKPAERNPSIYHGVGAFDVETGICGQGKEDFSFAFGEHLAKMARKHEDIVAISAAMIDGTGLNAFAAEFPDRVFDVGIAEQHAVTLAAGMALNGIKPFVAIYSTFLQRAYDQIIHDVCIQKAPVVFCVDRAGLVGADGETHQGIFDISYMASIPNLTIFSVSNYRQLRLAMEEAYRMNTPVAIRYPRGSEVRAENSENEKGIGWGEFEEWMVGSQHGAAENRIAIFTTGRALKVAADVQSLYRKKTGKTLRVFDVIKIKPLGEQVKLLISEYRHIITIEDHMVRGGFGDLVRSEGAEVTSFGYVDFIPHGSVDELYEHYGLSAHGIVDAILRIDEKT